MVATVGAFPWVLFPTELFGYIRNLEGEPTVRTAAAVPTRGGERMHEIVQFQPFVRKRTIEGRQRFRKKKRGRNKPVPTP